MMANPNTGSDCEQPGETVPMLKIEGLTKRYGSQPKRRRRRRSKPSESATPVGDRLALDNLNLNLRPGEIYGLLGPNGAGKTTTINLICNLLAPDAGSIAIAGQPVSEATKQLVGVVPQKNLLYGSLTCAENLNFFAQLYGVPGLERRFLRKLAKQSRIAQCLAQVNLTDRAKSPAESLSGGMKRRLSIALALIHQPKLVILDEPTTGLDIEARYELWELIRQLKSQGVTVMLTTHLLEEAERLCDRIGIIREGQLLQEGSLAELRQVIPAQMIAQLECNHESAILSRAQTLGWPTRRYGSGIALWLPEPLSLPELLATFPDISIQSAALHPIRLEHIYLEITRQPSTQH